MLTSLYTQQTLCATTAVCTANVQITQGKTERYAYTQEGLDELLPTLPATPAVSLQRFKGLGEMMPQQLWETTMDPDKRTLKAVRIEDAAVADKVCVL